MATPYATTHLVTVGSTQDEAWGRFDGTPHLVTAASQTGGRGRSGAVWKSAPRAVAASLAFAPDWPPEAWPRFTLVAGLAARDAIEARVSLKWPNDIVLSGLKLGGILAESRDDGIVVGWGVNMWWPQAPDGMGALYHDDPGQENAKSLAVSWASSMLERADRGPDDWGRAEYIEACETIGAEVSWEPSGNGIAIDVDDAGALVVQTVAGVVHLSSGSVHSVRSVGGTTPTGRAS